jgi:hypothetical protein
MIYEIKGSQLARVSEKLRSLHYKEAGTEFRTYEGKLLRHIYIKHCHCTTAKLWRTLQDLPVVQDLLKKISN